MTKNYIFICLLLSAHIAPAQHSSLTKLTDQIEAFRLALIDPTNDKLNALVMSKLSYGHSGGRVEDKKTFIENLVNGHSNFEEITLSDQQITVQHHTAIVRHRLSAKTNDLGKNPADIVLHVMTVWVKDGKTWKLLARQAVKL
jgi:hypothetical protein